METKSSPNNSLEISNHLKNLSDAEKTPTTSEFPFNLISKKISFLNMFCKIVDNHPEELEGSYRIQSKERKFKPSASLVDYFILNIFMFYECAKRKFKFKDSDLPPTYKKVKRFRHKVMAHFDKKIKTNAQLVKEYIIINNPNFKGFDKIYKDYLKFREEIFKRIKNEN